MPFSEVRPKKTFVYVAEQITEAVRRGEFAPGDMLPAERELAEKFRVSRQVIREALAALQLAGVVETRAGLGTVVRQPFGQDATAKIWALDDEESPVEVLEARLVIEPAIVRLAAARLTPESRERLGNLVAAMKVEAGKAAQGEPNQFGALDLQFHQEVVRASGNAVFVRFMEAVVGYANQRLWRAIREQAYGHDHQLARVYLGHHETMFEALIAGDGDRAGQAMLEHLKAAEVVWFGDRGEES